MEEYSRIFPQHNSTDSETLPTQLLNMKVNSNFYIQIAFLNMKYSVFTLLHIAMIVLDPTHHPFTYV